MNLTATHINYFQICKRKLWLFANGINMEHTSDTVYDGKLLHENSYLQRANRYEELKISAIYSDINLIGQIDFYDAKNNEVHEIKRSNKIERAHKWQLKFYLWLLELNGVLNATGLLEYPKLRQIDKVFLTNEDKMQLQQNVFKIKSLLTSNSCPLPLNAKLCKSCSYYEFCYSGEG